MRSAAERPDRSRTVVVVDGGGSGTRAAASVGGRRRATVRGPSCSVQSVGERAAVDNLVAILRRVWEELGGGRDRPDSTVVAVSHAATEGRVASLAAQLAERSQECPPLCAPQCWLVNDIVALVAQAPIGAVCGSGTGFAARSPNGRWARASGLEYVLTDEGGGFDIGLRGLRAVVRARDGRGDATALSEHAKEWLSSDPQILFDRIHGGVAYKPLVAAFAPYVLRAAGCGDAVAERIVRDAAGELVAGIDAVARRTGLPEDSEAVLSGSLLVGGEPTLRRLLAEDLVDSGRRYRLRDAQPDSLVGVGILAIRLAEEPDFVAGFNLATTLGAWTRR